MSIWDRGLTGGPSLRLDKGSLSLYLPCRNLRVRGWMGHIEVDHETGKLTIRVRMEGSKTAHQDLKTLSGGERSFITICFLLALGKQLLAKFHCLDEFDVFMDSLSQGVSTLSSVHTLAAAPSWSDIAADGIAGGRNA